MSEKMNGNISVDLFDEEFANVSPEPIEELPAVPVVAEEEEAVVAISQSVVPDIPVDECEGTDAEMSVEELLGRIATKLEQLEADDTYRTLLETIANNHQLCADNLGKIEHVRGKIIEINKRIKDFSDMFSKELLKNDWFDKYYDAVCLFERAHDSNESLEWCEAMRDVLGESVNDCEKNLPKIRALLNRRVPNSVFTLSVKTPYMRLKSGIFNKIESDVVNQTKSFYPW